MVRANVQEALDYGVNIITLLLYVHTKTRILQFGWHAIFTRSFSLDIHL